jgi:hypothetical protein
MKSNDLFTMLGFTIDKLLRYIPKEERPLALLEAAEEAKGWLSINDQKGFTAKMFESFNLAMPTFDIFEKATPLDDNITGEWVIVRPDCLLARFRNKESQLVLATGGFGCKADKMGRAVFCKPYGQADDPMGRNSERWDRGQLLGMASEEQIAEVAQIMRNNADHKDGRICPHPFCIVCK